MLSYRVGWISEEIKYFLASGWGEGKLFYQHCIVGKQAKGARHFHLSLKIQIPNMNIILESSQHDNTNSHGNLLFKVVEQWCIL